MEFNRHYGKRTDLTQRIIRRDPVDELTLTLLDRRRELVCCGLRRQDAVHDEDGGIDA